MPAESTSELVVRYGFPLFWVGLGVVQWFWPSAILVAFSDGDVTPGARGFAVLWLVVGSTLGLLFVPWLAPFGGWFVPGFVLLAVGGLQFVRPVWTLPVDGRPRETTAALFAASGAAALLVGLL